MVRSNILVVEDDPDVRDSLNLVLTHRGFDVSEAANGKEALDRMRERLPSVILLDLMMPVMNGWEFLRAQSQEPALADVPVIVMTAQPGDTAELTACVRLVLHKPLQLANLMAAIQENVRGQSSANG